MEVNNQEWKNERIFPSSRLNSLTVVAQQREIQAQGSVREQTEGRRLKLNEPYTKKEIRWNFRSFTTWCLDGRFLSPHLILRVVWLPTTKMPELVIFGGGVVEGVEKLGRLGLALLCTIKLASGIEQLISLRCQSAECEVMDLVWLQFFVVGNALNQHYLWSVSMCRWKTHSLRVAAGCGRRL